MLLLLIGRYDKLKGGAGSSKRKQPEHQDMTAAGDAAPHSMLMNTLMPPKVK